MSSTTSLSKRFLHWTLFSGAALAGACASAQDVGIRAAMVPDANFVIIVNAESFRDAPIFPALDGLRTSPPQGGEQPNGRRQFEEQVKRTLGIAREDFEGVVFSMDVSGLIAEGEARHPDVNKVPYCGGIRLKKSVTHRQVTDLLRLASGVQGKELQIFRDQHGQDPLVIFQEQAGPGRPNRGGASAPVTARVAMALVDGGTALFFGSAPGVRGALDRYHAGELAPPSDAMLESWRRLPEGSQIFAVATIPQAVREELKRQQGVWGEHESGGAMASMMGMLSGLRGLSLGAHAHEQLDVTGQLVLNSAQEAEQIREMAEPLVTAALLKGGSGQLKEERLRAMESIRFAVDGASVLLRVSLSQDDAARMQSLRGHRGGSPARPPARHAPAVPTPYGP